MQEFYISHPELIIWPSAVYFSWHMSITLSLLCYFIQLYYINTISAASKAYLLSGSSVRSEDLAKSKNQKENLLKSNKSIQKVQLFQQAFMSNELSDLWPITWPMLSQAMYSLKLWPSILLGSLKAIPLFLLFLKFISNHESGLFSWNF